MARLFISHSSQQVAWCRPFVAALRAEGHTCFYDEDSIPGTAAWVRMIEDGIRDCDVFVLVLSPVAYASRWVGEEINLALVDDKPILVAVLEPTPVQGLVRTRQWVQVVGLDAPVAAGVVLRALPQTQATQTPIPLPTLASSVTVNPNWEETGLAARLYGLGFRGWRDKTTGVSFILPSTVPVAAGVFTMGSAVGDPQAYKAEQPQYIIPVAAFRMGTFPVTVVEYGHAVAAGAVPVPPGEDDNRWGWKQQQHYPDHPVERVSWHDVVAYGRWLAQVTGQPWRLPTEAEWEKAARWDADKSHARVYPWGDQWDKARANTGDGGPGGTTAVGAYAEKGDISPYGVHDMSGNVWEWVSTTWYAKPPYDIHYEKDADTTTSRVLRGGSWYNGPRDARAACRNWGDSEHHNDYCGFRLALFVTG